MTPIPPRESSEERAKLAQLEAWEKMAVWFDGGPELLSHEQMHRHHETEPYIGCLFCRDKFMPVSEHEDEIAAWVEMTREAEAQVIELTETIESHAAQCDAGIGEIARLREAARVVVVALDAGRIVQVPDDEPCPELDALRRAVGREART